MNMIWNNINFSKEKSVLLSLFGLPLAISLFTTIKSIVKDGMFIDGIAYANIAKNISNGIGTTWSPLIDKGGEVFYEHPPFVFWLESNFFALFGNGKHTEDIFNLTIFASTVYIMYLTWTEIVKEKHAKLFFFPLIGFSLSQEVQLRYANNLLECTLSLVTLITFYAFVKLVDKRSIVAAALCGIGAFVGFLCKGPVGIFPLAMPIIYYLIIKKRVNLISVFTPPLAAVICFLLLFIHEGTFAFINQYIDVQVIAALTGNRIENISDSRFNILFGLIKLNLPFLILSLILHLGLNRFKREKTVEKRPYLKESLFCIFVGLSAIIPITISIKQASYYQIPSLPFIILSISLFLAEDINTFLVNIQKNRIARTMLPIVSALAMAAGLTFCALSVNTIDRRNVEHIGVAAKISDHLQESSAESLNMIVSGTKTNYTQSYSHPVPAFLNRYHDKYISKENEAFLLHITDPKSFIPCPSSHPRKIFTWSNGCLCGTIIKKQQPN